MGFRPCCCRLIDMHAAACDPSDANCGLGPNGTRINKPVNTMQTASGASGAGKRLELETMRLAGELDERGAQLRDERAARQAAERAAADAQAAVDQKGAELERLRGALEQLRRCAYMLTSAPRGLLHSRLSPRPHICLSALSPEQKRCVTSPDRVRGSFGILRAF